MSKPLPTVLPFRTRSIKRADKIPVIAGKFTLIAMLRYESVQTFEGLRTARKIVLRNAVKPFGNSQKGIPNGRLTWIAASDKYPGIK